MALDITAPILLISLGGMEGDNAITIRDVLFLPVVAPGLPHEVQLQAVVRFEYRGGGAIRLTVRCIGPAGAAGEQELVVRLPDADDLIPRFTQVGISVLVGEPGWYRFEAVINGQVAAQFRAFFKGAAGSSN